MKDQAGLRHPGEPDRNRLMPHGGGSGMICRQPSTLEPSGEETKMTDTLNLEMSRIERRRFILRGLTRALILSSILILLYFLGPLDRIDAMPVWVVLVIAPLILLAVSAWQIRAILRSDQPGLRGIEALSIVAPLYLILFAVAYFLMARADPGSFTVEGLTRVDTLYFTTTVFSTVGFGDISPASEPARIVAMIQMILNLIVLGAGVKLLTAAVQRGRASKATEAETDPSAPEGS